jgi:CRP/FNR family transcriptional regulator, cyclic AMP receptor protein
MGAHRRNSVAVKPAKAPTANPAPTLPAFNAQDFLDSVGIARTVMKYGRGGPGDFFGEGCLAGQALRMGSATAITPSVIRRVPKRQMADLLHKQSAMSDRFISHMLTRNIRIEEDLIDQLFNSSEKRLSRTLLLLARYGKRAVPVRVVPTISQDTLAEMVGTTRSRVNFFLNKFRKLGFIEYSSKLPMKINSSLLSVVLHD